MEQFAIQYGFLILPLFCLAGLAYAFYKEQAFFAEEERLVPDTCNCGCDSYEYRGLQEGPAQFDVDLFNCKGCGTTRGVKTTKGVWE